MNNQPHSQNTECKQAPGSIAPVINRNKCEGKADCAVVCPKHVFIIDTLPKQDRKNLSLVGKLKGFAHGWQQALMPNIDACEGCGLCVSACPENAISLKVVKKTNGVRP